MIRSSSDILKSFATPIVKYTHSSWTRITFESFIDLDTRNLIQVEFWFEIRYKDHLSIKSVSKHDPMKKSDTENSKRFRSTFSWVTSCPVPVSIVIGSAAGRLLFIRLDNNLCRSTRTSIVGSHYKQIAVVNEVGTPRHLVPCMSGLCDSLPRKGGRGSRPDSGKHWSAG